MRPLILGNGTLTILVDKAGGLRDFYFPYVGQENHIDEQGYKIGIWVEGKFSWIDETWNPSFAENHGVGEISFENPSLQLRINITCTVAHNKNIFLQKITLQNREKKEREIRLFISQHFRISGGDIGNTAYYHPKEHVIIFYKGSRYFLISGLHQKKSFDDYAVGIAHFKEWEGTYRDAEDGLLSKNPIQHGSVDATIAFHLNIQAEKEASLYHYIACGKKYQEVMEEKASLLRKTPEKLLEETRKYWQQWIKKAEKRKLLFLPKQVYELAVKSLPIIKMHADSQNGGIIASLDSEILAFNKDTYSYVWPRDAAFILLALDNAGYHEVSEKFFSFAERVMTRDGYLLQKYNADYSLGSSWHPWSKHDTLRLPIQEDETALVLYAFNNHLEKTKQTKKAKEYYNTLIKPAADFMVKFRDKKTLLPEESYNLWEEKFGIHTFTACTVYGALKSAAKISRLLKREDWKRYEKAAEEIQAAIFKHLCDPEKKVCIKRVHKKDNEYIPYEEIDMSTLYALTAFDLLPPEDPLLKSLAQQVENTLTTPGGGIARYQNDNYMKVPGDYPGNPWIITSMWLAQYYINTASSKEEMKKAESLILWAADRALSTGVLAEQFNPYSLEPLSACPLAWSSAAFVETVLKYEEKMKLLAIKE